MFFVLLERERWYAGGANHLSCLPCEWGLSRSGTFNVFKKSLYILYALPKPSGGLNTIRGLSGLAKPENPRMLFRQFGAFL